MTHTHTLSLFVGQFQALVPFWSQSFCFFGTVKEGKEQIFPVTGDERE